MGHESPQTVERPDSVNRGRELKIAVAALYKIMNGEGGSRFIAIKALRRILKLGEDSLPNGDFGQIDCKLSPKKGWRVYVAPKLRGCPQKPVGAIRKTKRGVEVRIFEGN